MACPVKRRAGHVKRMDLCVDPWPVGGSRRRAWAKSLVGCPQSRDATWGTPWGVSEAAICAKNHAIAQADAFWQPGFSRQFPLPVGRSRGGSAAQGCSCRSPEPLPARLL